MVKHPDLTPLQDCGSCPNRSSCTEELDRAGHRLFHAQLAEKHPTGKTLSSHAADLGPDDVKRLWLEVEHLATRLGEKDIADLAREVNGPGRDAGAEECDRCGGGGKAGKTLSSHPAGPSPDDMKGLWREFATGVERLDTGLGEIDFAPSLVIPAEGCDRCGGGDKAGKPVYHAHVQEKVVPASGWNAPKTSPYLTPEREREEYRLALVSAQRKAGLIRARARVLEAEKAETQTVKLWTDRRIKRVRALCVDSLDTGASLSPTLVLAILPNK